MTRGFYQATGGERERVNVQEGTTLSELLSDLGLTPTDGVVSINGSIVNQADLSTRTFAEGETLGYVPLKKTSGVQEFNDVG